MHTTIDIQGGHSQVNPAATQAIQNNYYGQLASPVESVVARTVVVLGAGADAAVGFPTPASLIPKITDWLETDEGKAVDEALRKQFKGLRFRFDKFVDDAIDRLAHDLDSEREAICAHIRRELDENEHLEEYQRKMGQLIIRIFQKISDVKVGASIDEETEELIREVTGIEPTEETIIDFSHVNYTRTFSEIIKHILHASLHDTENPVLRPVYTNLLDIGQLLAQYFYGFFVNKSSCIKTYLYIAWTLWAYLVHEEQALAFTENLQTRPTFCGQLQDKELLQVITFNHTSWAADVSPSSIYFNGNLTDYVDIENKNDFRVDNLHALNLTDFFRHRFAEELSLEGDRLAIPIPSFMPPLKLTPVISNSYVSIWYRSAQSIACAERILILGHSLQAGDVFFNDMLRANRQAEIIVIDQDLETTCRSVCAILQQSENRYSSLSVQGHPARKYGNRITVVGAELTEIDIREWLE